MGYKLNPYLKDNYNSEHIVLLQSVWKRMVKTSLKNTLNFLSYLVKELKEYIFSIFSREQFTTLLLKERQTLQCKVLAPYDVHNPGTLCIRNKSCENNYK